MGAYTDQRRHELKTWPASFNAIWGMRKLHDIRVNDRGFKVGDELFLREWDPGTKQYTGRYVLANISYVTEGEEWGLPADRVVMSIKVQLWNRTGAA